jgi:hypothetical protein
MTSPIEPAPEDELQFKTAEPAPADATAAESTNEPAGAVCANCQRPIVDEYFALNEHAICPDCRVLLESKPVGSRMGRLFKAGMFGLGAGLLGAAIWFTIRRISGYEIGLVAVLVGFLVGKAVRYGSGNRGGPAYQAIAVILTYCCIAANYVPDIVEAFMSDFNPSQLSAAPSDAASGAASTTAPVAATEPTHLDAFPASADENPGILRVIWALIVVSAVIFGIALAAPFLSGTQNAIGLLIIGFALWEAWKFTKRVQLPITGPYKLGDAPVSAGVSGTAV